MPRHVNTLLAAAAVVAGLGVAALGMVPATAQDAPGRFTMTPTDGGFIRMDTQTGAMSLCTGRAGDWACRAMPDDQKKLQERIAQLEQENQALKDENRRLEDVMGLNSAKPEEGGTPGAPGEAGPPGQPRPGFKLPTEKDLDQAFDYFEGMLKKFRDRLKKLEEEEKKDKGVPL